MAFLIFLAFAIETLSVLGMLGFVSQVSPDLLAGWIVIHLVACALLAFAMSQRTARSDRLGMAVLLFVFSAPLPGFGVAIAACMGLATRRVGRRGVFDEFKDYIKMEVADVRAHNAQETETLERDMLTEPLVDLLADSDAGRTRGAIDKFAKRSDRHAVETIREFLVSENDSLRLHASATLARIESRLNDALFAASEKVEKEPTAPDCRMALAEAYVTFCHSGLLDEVTQRHYRSRVCMEYETALQLQPENQAAVAGLAAMQIEQGNGQEAARRLEEAVASDPKDPTFRLLLGRAYFALGRYGDVRATLKQCDPAALTADAETAALVAWWGGTMQEETP